MGTLQALLNILSRSWIARFLYYAMAFWGLDLILHRLIPLERTEVSRVLTSVLVAALFVVLEIRQPPAGSEARNRRRAFGLIIALVLVIIAVIIMVADSR